MCSNPFRPQWCPAGTRCCRTHKDTGLFGIHVGKCILGKVMENSHLYKLRFYSIHSKFVWLIQSNYCIWVTVCGLTVCPVTMKTPCELSFLWGDKVLLIFASLIIKVSKIGQLCCADGLTGDSSRAPLMLHESEMFCWNGQKYNTVCWVFKGNLICSQRHFKFCQLQKGFCFYGISRPFYYRCC